ncbi:hypothetical protein SKAU_G00253670 [Synaphobranchus kaupii]|uniref:Uncharacterized protein n=1 Tax=Synaphobranchus kaupii TaxID=118154 RepID=A0A9Q1F3R8_SYNKA|nr:hypothetical protein SKAU_G00253670 [Synaphobranchus kaupii]
MEPPGGLMCSGKLLEYDQVHWGWGRTGRMWSTQHSREPSTGCARVQPLWVERVPVKYCTQKALAQRPAAERDRPAPVSPHPLRFPARSHRASLAGRMLNAARAAPPRGARQARCSAVKFNP